MCVNDIVAKLDEALESNSRHAGKFMVIHIELTHRARDEIAALRKQLTESTNRYEEMLGDMNHEANVAKSDRDVVRAEALEQLRAKCEAMQLDQRRTWDNDTNHLDERLHVYSYNRACEDVMRVLRKMMGGPGE